MIARREILDQVGRGIQAVRQGREHEGVGPGAAGHLVEAAPAVQDVIAPVPDEHVRAIAAGQHVGVVVPRQGVGETRAGQVLDRTQGVDPRPDRVLRTRNLQADRHAGRRAGRPRGVGGGVASRSAVEDVVPRPSDQRVVASTAIEGVVPVETVQHVGAGRAGHRVIVETGDEVLDRIERVDLAASDGLRSRNAQVDDNTGWERAGNTQAEIDRVGSSAAHEDVAAVPVHERVVAAVADEGVVPIVAPKDIGAVVAGQMIVVVRAGEALDRGQSVVSAAAGVLAARDAQIDGHGGRGRKIGDYVRAPLPVDNIVAGARQETIAEIVTRQVVVERRSIDTAGVCDGIDTGATGILRP